MVTKCVLLQRGEDAARGGGGLGDPRQPAAVAVIRTVNRMYTQFHEEFAVKFSIKCTTAVLLQKWNMQDVIL